MLQCGRGPKPTEIKSRKCFWQETMQASMWPRAEAHGNVCDLRIFSRVWLASMWPRAEAHGNLQYLIGIEPHPKLQCGRGPKPTEMPPAERPSAGADRASMWPRAEAHGNRYSAPSSRGRPRASMWPRAEAHGNEHPSDRISIQISASMWPRAEAHGNPGEWR